MGLFTELSLGIDQRVDLCLNVSVEDGMINGATGIIKYVDNVHDIHIIWIQFDDISVGKACRHAKKELYNSKIAPSWTPISQIGRQFRIGHNKNAQVMRKQFPLRPATAKTVHRCQGDTMKEIVVDMSGARSQCHIHYVALSRVTSLNGLYVLHLNPAKINEEVEDLRSTRYLKINSQPIDGNTTIIHQNTRSLRKHISDIVHDTTITSADILLFTECHLSEAVTNDELYIEGFTLFKNIPSHAPVSNSPYGTVIYTKNNITTLSELTLNINNVEITLSKKKTLAGSLQIAVVYRSKKMANLKDIFEQKGRTGPYPKPIKVKVCAKAKFQTNTDSTNSSQLTVFGVADNSSAAKALVYGEEKLVNFIVGNTILIINANVKTQIDKCIIITKQTKVIKTSSISVDEQIQTQAERLANPPPADNVKLQEIHISPAKKIVSVEGQIISQELVRTVQVKASPVKIRNISLQDATGTCRVTLWRDQAERNWM
ncbi:hypothetical protein BSL78_16696 [Apostichopus japonicus]|uniref:Uncharacterized protein n=1 Tax=Stichopus japonicus TaxID=307972 RepID=A0A2G8KEQ5_STIJA|nr:hypothetical protein BSL78_16696 [Apostichopus japonicus]